MDRDLEFVDTHVHFFDHDQPDLRWSWLEPGVTHADIGNIEGMKSRRYTAPEFVAESRFQRVRRCVHVQAALGTADPVAETRWLQAMADEQGMPQAIVAEAHLQDPAVGDTLARHARFPNLRGIRDFAHGDYLVDPDFERGYAQLAHHDWIYDLDTEYPHFSKAAALAARHPQTVMVVDHAGFPRARTDDYLAAWRRELRHFAGLDNVVMKISGLGMCDPRWTLESLRPWVHECLEVFGPDRAVFGTNWPLDRLFSGYSDIVDAYRVLIADLSPTEQHQLFVGNATRLFRL
ncbi:MAG: amidohydrolase family protein [Nitriliruptoraceae bacterium]|nr:amidohydrolase family protein [Nitriliruptoraceae bacterium]